MGRPYKYNKELKLNNPIHYSSFHNIHKRSKRSGLEVDPDFQTTNEGFKAFIEYLGPIPEGMIKPTVGREDHSKGYIRGNFQWQSRTDNSSEAAKRTNINKVKFLSVVKKSKELEEYLFSTPSGFIISLWELKMKFNYSDIRTIKRRISLLITNKNLHAKCDDFYLRFF